MKDYCKADSQRYILKQTIFRLAIPAFFRFRRYILCSESHKAEISDVLVGRLFSGVERQMRVGPLM